MKFTDSDGTTYLLEFERQYRERPSHVPLNKKGQRQRAIITTARLMKVIDTGFVKGTKIVREATVSPYFKDRLTYEGGRKCALALALYDAPTKGGGTPLIGTPLTKEFRTKVWEAYHNR